MAVPKSKITEEITKKQKKKDSMLLVQDLNYSRNLSTNDEKVRRKSLKYLKNYLKQRSDAHSLLTNNYKVIWKGLFYSMWMSDKPLVQEECAENIAHLIHCLQFPEAMQFYKFGMLMLQNEWIGIDQLRLDKFLMFVRRLLRQALLVLQKNNFKKQSNLAFAKVLEETVLSTSSSVPMGLLMHFTEIYLEELAKVSEGKLQSNRTLDLLQPFITRLSFCNDYRIIQSITKFIFTHLMKQHKLGLAYEEKYKVWKQVGFVGSINQVQKIIVDDDNSEEKASCSATQKPSQKPLDPRAGKVDVELPQILFNAKEISKALLLPKSNASTTKTSRKHLALWSEKFMKLHNGIYPLGLKSLEPKKKEPPSDICINKSAIRLTRLEQRLSAESEDSRKRTREPDKHHSDEGDEVDKKKRKMTVIAKKPEEDNHTEMKNNGESSEQNLTGNKNRFRSFKDTECKIMVTPLDKNFRPFDHFFKRKSVNSKDDKRIFAFGRNSGVWIVTPFDSNETSTDSTTKDKLSVDKLPVKPTKKKLMEAKDERTTILMRIEGNKKTPQKRDTPKKVVFDTTLNVSQEIDDHIERVKASPQIPWDSSRKPGKPLLKSPVKSSPVNPFYNMNTF